MTWLRLLGSARRRRFGGRCCRSRWRSSTLPFDAALTAARQTLRLDQLRLVLQVWRRVALQTERDPDGYQAMLAEAFEVLRLVPERGQPINPANPTGGVYQRVTGHRDGGPARRYRPRRPDGWR